MQIESDTRSRRVLQEEQDPQFEPVIKLTEQVETKTNEEDEEAIFKMYVSYTPNTSRSRSI